MGAGFTDGGWSAIGTPVLIGVSRDTVFATEAAGLGVGFGVTFATGVFATGVLTTGVLTAGTLGVVATVRLVETDFAHTVTEVGPVFDE